MGSLIYTKNDVQMASFKSAAKVPLTSAIVTFGPTQAGSGDPSPNNVRPISGLTGLNITACGKNLIQFEEGETESSGLRWVVDKDGIITVNGTLSVVSFSATSKEVTLEPGEYSVLCTSGVTVAYEILKDNVVYDTPLSNTPYTLIVTERSIFSFCAIISSSNQIPNTVTFQLEKGPINTTFTPYKGIATTIDWSSSAGTVYGGYINLISGELIIEYKLCTITGEESGLIYNWDGVLLRVPDSVNSNNTYIIKACSHTNNYITGGGFFNSSRSTNPNTTVNDICVSGSQGSQLRFRKRDLDPDYTKDVELYRTWLRQQNTNGTPLQIVYKLTNPITYQLTPLQLSTLVGQNNLFCQEDGITNISVSYPICDTSAIREAKKRVYNFMSSGNVLPPAYQQVDFLLGNGSNTRINTNVSGDDTTLEIKGAFMPIELVTSYQGIFGNYKSENDHYCWRIISYANTNSYFNSNFYLTTGNNSPGGGGTIAFAPYGQGVSTINKKISFHMKYGECIVTGGSTVTYTRSFAEKQANTNSIAIGASYVTNTSGASKFRFYNFKFYSHNILIRNYVPCYRKSDNKAGFYDTINHTFNPSIGTQEFTAGND